MVENKVALITGAARGLGPFMTIKHAFPIMKKQSYGRIVNMASINGLRHRRFECADPPSFKNRRHCRSRSPF